MAEAPRQICLVGGSGGIGRALLGELLERYSNVRITATRLRGEAPFDHPRLAWRRVDLRDEGSIETLAAEFGRVDWLLNCAGFLHGDAGRPEKSIRAFKAEFLLENIRVNTLPTLLLAKHFSAALKKSPAPLLAAVSARVGSITDNRLGGWYSYRVSKAALNMALKTLSIEWRHSHPRGCVTALHPGTNDTALSKPYQADLAHELFDPAVTAASFVDLLAGLDASQSGRFHAWNGDILPW